LLREHRKTNFEAMNNLPSRYLVVIAGPTAVGKTALAIQLAKHFRSVIISADSRQFYRELSIGTAKPNEEQLKEIPHYFVNNKSINELYGAGHFEKEAIDCLTELFEAHSILFMVGGSGLYIDAVLNGVDEFIDIPPTVRETLNTRFKEEGITWLQNELKHHDPEYFNKVDVNNSQRIVRALEVFTHTGIPYSKFLNREKPDRNFTPIKILINTERKELYERIDRRVDEMMKLGLLEEAKKFLDRRSLNALKTVGYKELYNHLDGTYGIDTAVEKIKQHTRNYAKRQLTWFKNKDVFQEFDSNDLEKIIEHINRLTNKNRS